MLNFWNFMFQNTFGFVYLKHITILHFNMIHEIFDGLKEKYELRVIDEQNSDFLVILKISCNIIVSFLKVHIKNLKRCWKKKSRSIIVFLIESIFINRHLHLLLSQCLPRTVIEEFLCLGFDFICPSLL